MSDLRDDRIVRRRGRQTGDAVSRLCRAWIRAGGDMFSGSMRIAADLADDVNADECAGGSRRDRGRERDRDR